MDAFYFGQSDNELFGIYHEPQRTTQHNQNSIVLCPSIADEYLTTHWSLVRLSNLLADSGFHVMRFDYSGTGDSAGDFEDQDCSRWELDIQTAVNEIGELAGTSDVTLIGFRLGALLGAASSTSARRLVAWEPPINGAEFVTSLRNSTERLKAIYGDRFCGPLERGLDELTGHLFSPSLLKSISALELELLIKDADYQVDLVTSMNDDRLTELARSNRCGYQRVEGTEQWLTQLHNLKRIHAPNEVLDKIKDVLTTE